MRTVPLIQARQPPSQVHFVHYGRLEMRCMWTVPLIQARQPLA